MFLVLTNYLQHVKLRERRNRFCWNGGMIGFYARRLFLSTHIPHLLDTIFIILEIHYNEAMLTSTIATTLMQLKP